MSKNIKWFALGAILALIVLTMRMELHAPNMVPVGALALWSGAYLGKRFAIPLVWGLLLVGDAGDLMHGRYPWWLAITVYTSMIIYVVFGSALARQIPEGLRRTGASFAAAFIGSSIYFAITNGAVWEFTPWYPKTITGLATCFTAGIPFWRNNALANAIGAVACFSLSALIAATAQTKKEALQANRSEQ